jgi:hypothetical protein
MSIPYPHNNKLICPAASHFSVSGHRLPITDYVPPSPFPLSQDARHERNNSSLSVYFPPSCSASSAFASLCHNTHKLNHTLTPTMQLLFLSSHNSVFSVVSLHPPHPDKTTTKAKAPSHDRCLTLILVRMYTHTRTQLQERRG